MSQPDPSKPDLPIPLPISHWQRGTRETQTQTLLARGTWLQEPTGSPSMNVQMEAVGAEAQEAHEKPLDQWKQPRGSGGAPQCPSN